MIKVMWFLTRAEHLSLQQFSDWWLTQHSGDVAHHQGAHLRKYVVNVRNDALLLGAGTSDGFDWDGVAEQWFADVAAYNAAYTSGPSPTRADTLAHTSRFARLVVDEHEIRIQSA